LLDDLLDPELDLERDRELELDALARPLPRRPL
jgi:hypothetical protein